MIIEITLKNNSAEELKHHISEMPAEDYKKLQNQIANGEIRMIKINDILLSVSEIASIKATEERISKKFQLPGKGKSTLTPQEKKLEAIKTIAEMGRISDFLKKKGIIKNSRI